MYGWSVLLFGTREFRARFKQNFFKNIYKLIDFETRIELKNKNTSIKLAALLTVQHTGANNASFHLLLITDMLFETL